MKKHFLDNKTEWLLMSLAFWMMSLPFATDFLHQSVEMINTLSRIQGFSEAMFRFAPIRIVPLPDNALGYSAAAFQADLVYLLPGVLHKMGLGLMGAYKLTMSLLNVVYFFCC